MRSWYCWSMWPGCQGEYSATVFVLILMTYQGAGERRSEWKMGKREQAECWQRLLTREVSSLVFAKREP